MGAPIPGSQHCALSIGPTRYPEREDHKSEVERQIHRVRGSKLRRHWSLAADKHETGKHAVPLPRFTIGRIACWIVDASIGLSAVAQRSSWRSITTWRVGCLNLVRVFGCSLCL